MSLQKCIGGYVYIIVQLGFGMGITLQRFYLFTTNQFISFFLQVFELYPRLSRSCNKSSNCFRKREAR